jgi:hypothetical protein
MNDRDLIAAIGERIYQKATWGKGGYPNENLLEVGDAIMEILRENPEDTMEKTTPEGRLVFAAAYEPAGMSYPAFLTIEVINDDGTHETLTLQGKAAKKFSQIKPGDLYTTAEEHAQVHGKSN